MADDKAQEEPSVEETLASIRRIISEDDAAGELDREGAEASRTRDDAVARDAAGEDEGVLELTEMVTDDGTVVSLTEAAAAGEGEAPSAPEGKEQAAPPKAAAEGKPEQEQQEEPAGAEGTVEFGDGLRGRRVPTGEEARVTPSAEGEEGLISEAVAGISTDAFAALAEALTRERRTGDAAGLGEADRTIEQVVREELRPLLKEWLDQNLPSVVERLVKQELERMASRARDR